MTTPAPYIDALERALGRVIAQSNTEAQRQIELFSARCDAALAAFQAKQGELDARIADLDRIVTERVEAGVETRLGEIEARLRETTDDAPLVTLSKRVDAVELRGAEFAAVETRLTEVEAREAPDAEFIARGVVSAAIAELPEPRDWSEEIAEVRAAIPEPVEVPDVSGFATREEVEAVRAAIPEVPEPKDWTPEIAAVAERSASEAATMKEAAIATLEEVRERLARHPGNFPRLKGWTDGVHYTGDVVVHDGATWQARQDTGKPPPHEDWTCIAAKGDKGDDGRSWTVRGTYGPEEMYHALDVVMLDGSSFVARQDDPGECPGDGWQLAASRGGRGKPGESAKAIQGRPGEPVIAADVSDDGVLTLTNGDGSTVEADLYPLLAKVQK
ncbi:MAG: hypothetical protein V2I43_08770 [Parvularcula sp.]|nr:hypothetical protein [Parvularcula sp.]